MCVCVLFMQREEGTMGCGISIGDNRSKTVYLSVDGRDVSVGGHPFVSYVVRVL